MASEPGISVVIPTYNRDELLGRTLHQLARQQIGTDQFEVIVCDDGSTDDTKAVVESFSDRLRLDYHFQEDLGFRAATARNAGARLAHAPVLLFLDCGAIPGPEFLTHHLRVHGGGGPRLLSLAYAYGYNPAMPMPGLQDLLDRYPPEQVVARFCEDPAFFDLRHDELHACGFDPNRRTLPWSLAWTIGCSVTVEDFWAVGGFDDSFVGWGAEDLELGFRLHRSGVQCHLNRDGWVIESPHERDWEVLDPQFLANMGRFLDKHREPITEIGWVLVAKFLHHLWEESATELGEWTRRSRGLGVPGEIRGAVDNLPSDWRIAVFGCGGAVPDTLAPAVLLDFDRELLESALGDPRHTGYHALGGRSPVPDQSLDAGIITSRLAGLRERWHDDLLAEARRIGRSVIDTGV